MRTQYIVKENDYKKRKEFYDYIINNYNLKICYPFDKEKFIINKFPFVIDFKEKIFFISESITFCACAAQSGVIYTIKEFKKFMKE